MKIIGILTLMFVLLWLWNLGLFTPLLPKVIAKEKLSKEYGGLYVFYPEFREEIKQRESERDEYMDNFFEKKDLFTKDDLAKLDSILPQTLSNGCKYHNQAFGSYRQYFEPSLESYYEKIREFVGDEVYEKIKYSLTITSFYRCKDGSEGLITIYTDIGTTYTKFGLFGDAGAGFRLTEIEEVDIGGSNTFELRNGKFEKTNKRRKGFR